MIQMNAKIIFITDITWHTSCIIFVLETNEVSKESI